jgi:hypothetical protein
MVDNQSPHVSVRRAVTQTRTGSARNKPLGTEALKHERGLGNPEFHTIVRLAAVLNVDPAELVRGIAGHSLPERPAVFNAAEFVRERTKRQAR